MRICSWKDGRSENESNQTVILAANSGLRNHWSYSRIGNGPGNLPAIRRGKSSNSAFRVIRPTVDRDAPFVACRARLSDVVCSFGSTLEQAKDGWNSISNRLLCAQVRPAPNRFRFVNSESQT